MIPIKIQCGCGQRYAFEVEAVNGAMPSPVACPVCGADGTLVANEVIAQALAVVPTPPSPTALRAVPAPAPETVAAPPAPRGGRLLPGQMERAQAENEARAKIFWGDAPESVVGFLLMQGLSREEAKGVVEGLVKERLANLRGAGMRKILIGAGLMCVPVVAYVVFAGGLPLRLFGMTVAVGLWGAWMVMQGAITLLAPKSEAGDVGDK